MEKHGESLALEPSAGRKVAQIAEAFGCHILCYSASGSKYNTTYEQVGLDELLSRSDIVSVHAPLNAYTENLMTLENFRKMKKTAIFLNLARGAIVNEADLYTALTEGSIGSRSGCALQRAHGPGESSSENPGQQ